MSRFGMILTGSPTYALLRRAAEDEAFRAEFFANRMKLPETYGIPEEYDNILQEELFAGVRTLAEFSDRLLTMMGLFA